MGDKNGDGAATAPEPSQEATPDGVAGATESERATGLGEAGRKALAAEREARRQAEKEAADARLLLAEATKDPLAAEREARLRAEQEAERAREELAKVTASDLVAEAAAKVREEVRRDMAAQVARANLVAEATGKLAHPELAAKLVDPASIPVGEDGAVDQEAVRQAVAKIAEEYPALAAGNGSGRSGAVPTGSADLGPRDAGDSYAAAIAKAVESGDLTAAIRLKQERAAAQSQPA